MNEMPSIGAWIAAGAVLIGYWAIRRAIRRTETNEIQTDLPKETRK